MGTDAHSLTFLALLLPFLGALAAPLLCRVLKHNAAWPLAAVPLFIFLHFAGFLEPVAQGRPVAGGYDWVPSLGVRFSWYLDGLSLTFALLISGIGTLIVLYSGGYLKGHPHQGRFLSFMLMFMGAMLGLVVSDSFLMLFVFWELTSITSFLLIGFDHSRRSRAPRRTCRRWSVTGLGGLSLLAGLLVLSADHRRRRSVQTAGVRRCRPRKPALSCGAAARARRRLHQIGAVPVPLLAAQCHGGADAGFGLPAFGDHGEGRRLSADAPQPGARRYGGVGDAAAAVRRRDAARRHVAGGEADRPQADAGLHDGRLARTAGDADRLRFGAGHRGGGALSGRACHVQGRAVHGRGADRP